MRMNYFWGLILLLFACIEGCNDAIPSSFHTNSPTIINNLTAINTWFSRSNIDPSNALNEYDTLGLQHNIICDFIIGNMSSTSTQYSNLDMFVD